MSVVRREYTGNYAVVLNSTADDENLKADALGVLVYLLAKPHDWQVNIANLRKRFGLGRNRVYDILGELAGAGYVLRTQPRNQERRFGDVEYVIFDSPDTRDAYLAKAGNMPETPLPQIREAAQATPRKPNKTPASPKTGMRKSGNILITNTTNPPSEGLSPPEGVLREKEPEQDNHPPSQAPSLNAQIWTGAKAILSPKEFGCVTGWLQRVRDKPKGAETLLAIIETARKQGTPQAVAYITGALNRVFPPPPDPKTIPRERWELLVLAAMNPNVNWDSAYGPRPGEPGCLVPPDLITPELVRAVTVRRVA